MKQFLSTILLIAMALCPAFSQSITVTGKVTDADMGGGLPGANVVIQGTTNGATTDIDGNYSIEVDGNQTLIFSFVGMEQVTEVINGRAIINVSLGADSEMLAEIMIVSYGTTTKESFTGSAQVVNAEVIEGRPVASFEKAMQGTTAGLQISSSSGQPGSVSQIRVRGTGSISASSSPLFVIDGVPMSGSIADLNPNDILSVNTIKDAAGASLYGSRAANGVIIITTKQGKKGKTKISFSAQLGSTERIADGYELMNSTDYYEHSWMGLYNQAILGGQTADSARVYAHAKVQETVGFNPFGQEQPLDDNGKLIPGTVVATNTNWRDLIYKNGLTQNYNLNVSGGTEATKVYFSLGYFSDNGTVLSSNFERLSGKVNVSHKINTVISAGMNTQFSLANANAFPSGSQSSNIVRSAEVINAATPLKLGNGEYNWDNTVVMDFNPVGISELDIYRDKFLRTMISAYVNLQFTPNLFFKTMATIEYSGYQGILYYNPEHGNGVGVNGRGNQTRSSDQATGISNILNWSKQFDKHLVEALVGQEAFNQEYSYLTGHATDYSIPGKFHLVLAAQPESPSSGESRWGLLSYFGQLKYEFDGKLNLSASYRTDGSSRFGENEKYGSFYSFGAGWTLSNENWMPDLNWLDYLRVRTSYGTSGNADIGNFASLSLYSGGPKYGGYPGIALSQIGDPNLTWEKQGMVNIGLEFNLFSRLSSTMEYYSKRSDALLYAEPLSRAKGLGSKLTNLADVKNEGFELLMEYKVVKKKNLNFTASVNLATNKSKYISLNGDPVQGATQLMEEGGLRRQFYVREWAGVNPDNGNPMWFTNEASDFNEENIGEPTSAFNDPNGSNRMVTSDYNDAEKIRMGTALPKLFGGFNNAVNYKNFGLNFYFYFSLGGQTYNYSFAENMHDGKVPGSNLAKEGLKAWTPNNRYTDVPIYSSNNSNQSNSISSRFLEEASYVRLKNISLSYTLPKALCERMFMQGAKVFVSGENIWTSTKYKGFDPEGALSGVTSSQIPGVKAYTVGIKIDL